MVGVRQPIREPACAPRNASGFQVNCVQRDGKAFRRKRMDVMVTLRPEATGMGEYELLSRLDLKPGRLSVARRR
jgi:hypothetical protein